MTMQIRSTFEHFSCRCHKTFEITRVGVAACCTCVDCGSNLVKDDDEHGVPAAHTWCPPIWEIDPDTGERWQVRMCVGCDLSQRIDAQATGDRTITGQMFYEALYAERGGKWYAVEPHLQAEIWNAAAARLRTLVEVSS